MVVDLDGVVLAGEVVRGGMTADGGLTGGPMREAGAVVSAAAGRPGVCAMHMPALPSAAMVTKAPSVFEKTRDFIKQCP